ncbi:MULTISPECIES: ABC transporter permease [unclassified Microbacterium]|uniref:ABC transporter permease n=1 Tax=unclassified Microbacterium TaxID=2609290 RepID=UPI00364AAFDA
MTSTELIVSPRRSRRRGLRALPPTAIVGAVVLAILALAAIVGPWLLPFSATDSGFDPNLPPGAPHLLGTSGRGQDTLAQLLQGGRASLGIGLLVAALTTIVGLIVGLVSAYFGGVVDATLSVVTNVFLVLPGLPLMVVLAAFLPPGPFTIVGVLSLTGWAFGARLFRSQSLSLRTRDFVAAAECAGVGRIRIMLTALLPNLSSVLAAFFVNQVVFAITAEASLEFLGLGDPEMVSWGTMLFWAQNNSSLLLGYWWQFVAPGLTIAITASSLVLINFAMDRASNPRLQAQELLHRFVGTGLRSASLITPVFRTSERNPR